MTYRERIRQIAMDHAYNLDHPEFNKWVKDYGNNSFSDAIIQAGVDYLVPQEKNGKHNGHREDDGYCYRCMETVEDKDASSFCDGAWNACRNEVKKRIEG